MTQEEQDERHRMMEDWHQDLALSTIRYNELVSVTNERNDLLVALMGEGMEIMQAVLAKALENQSNGIGNQLRMSNPYWIERYTRK
jgi:hypothetical protein